MTDDTTSLKDDEADRSKLIYFEYTNGKAKDIRWQMDASELSQEERSRVLKAYDDYYPSAKPAPAPR
jgi:hypothetical protein